MQSVVMAGVGMVPFTKPGCGKTYDATGEMAARAALPDAGIEYRAIQQAYVGYVYEDSTSGQLCKVVNFSSVAGVFGNAGQANYAAAKSGVIGMTKTLAKEWGRYTVNVHCVAFGFIETRLTAAVADAASTIEVEGREIEVGVNPQLLEMLKAGLPLGRPGTPDYVSGQLLVAGGGFEG